MAPPRKTQAVAQANLVASIDDMDADGIIRAIEAGANVESQAVLKNNHAFGHDARMTLIGRIVECFIPADRWDDVKRAIFHRPGGKLWDRLPAAYPKNAFASARLQPAFPDYDALASQANTVLDATFALQAGWRVSEACHARVDAILKHVDVDACRQSVEASLLRGLQVEASKGRFLDSSNTAAYALLQVAERVNSFSSGFIKELETVREITSVESTPLIHKLILEPSTQPGRANMLRHFLAGGADPNNATSVQKTTALQVCLKKDDVAVMDLLLDYGADPALRDKNGKSAMDHAKTKYPDSDCARLLKARAAHTAVQGVLAQGRNKRAAQ